MALDASPEAALVLEFVNTRDLRSFVPRGHPVRDGTRDDLDSPESLRDWLVGRGLLAEGRDVSASEHARALTLRATLRRAIDPARHGEPDDAPPFTAPLRVEIDPHEGPRLAASSDGVDDALGRICAAALRTSVSGEWWRVRACAADDCQWLFFDHSKPGRGRYCSPDMCGNRVKTRAYRQRRSAGTAG